MCNNSSIQRRVALERAKSAFLKGASIDHVLGEAWNAGFIEGGRIDETDDQEESDRRVSEINLEIEAIESGCCESARAPVDYLALQTQSRVKW